MFTHVSYNLPEHFQVNVTPEQRAKHAPRPMFLWQFAGSISPASGVILYYFSSKRNHTLKYCIVIRRFRRTTFIIKDNHRPKLIRLYLYFQPTLWLLRGILDWFRFQGSSRQQSLLKNTFSLTNLVMGIINSLEIY